MNQQRLESESRGVRRLLAAAVGFVLALLGLTLAAGPAAAQNAVGPQPVQLISTVGPTGTAGQESIGVRGPPLRPIVSATGVAAETAGDVPTVVFSRSRAPGIADNFDNAVANGAPTRLDRVSGAVRDANRRAALRGQAPAPAGQSLDEYPFACSAQGGCGSFVRAVPVGEQSYQGGVLSRFFQDNGIGVGVPFNVMFGP